MLQDNATKGHTCSVFTHCQGLHGKQHQVTHSVGQHNPLPMQSHQVLHYCTHSSTHGLNGPAEHTLTQHTRASIYPTSIQHMW